MVGSWIGFGIGTAILVIGGFRCIALCPKFISALSNVYIGLPLVYPIGGFLAGWLIQSLIKR